MEYIIRILRVLCLVLVLPIIFAISCVGIAMTPPTYGAISAYFYVKDGNNYNSKNSDYYTDVVFHFFMETIWVWSINNILKVK
jgi:hypothetical protein